MCWVEMSVVVVVVVGKLPLELVEIAEIPLVQPELAEDVPVETALAVAAKVLPLEYPDSLVVCLLFFC